MPPKKSKNTAAASSTPNRSKKRKADEERIAEEDERAMSYFLSVSQIEAEKKKMKEANESVPQEPKATTSASASPARKPASSARRKAAPPAKTSERLPPTEEKEAETAPPPTKRRRVKSPDDSATKSAKQWYNDTFVTPQVITGTPAQSPIPAPSAATNIDPDKESAKLWAERTYGISSKLTNAHSPNPTVALTNPASRIATPTRRNASTVTSTRQDLPASNSQFVPAPPSRQRKPVLSKAPFGSPLPTLSTSTAASSRSPPPVMPTVQELEAPTRNILSPKPRETVHLRLETAPVHSYDTVPEPEHSYTLPEDAVEELRRMEGPPLYKTETGIAILAFFGVLVLSVLIAVVVDPSTQFDGWKSLVSSLNGTTESVHLPCFDDYPVRSNLEIEEELLIGGGAPSKCFMDDVNPTKPCPEGGHCSGGQLKHCYDAIFQVSTDGTECTFTSEAQRQRDALRDLLIKYTVQHVCSVSLTPNPFYVKGSEDPPLFDYRALIDLLQIPYHPKLISHVTKNAKNLPMFQLERSEKDGSLLIGLHPSQVVELPLSCWMKQLATSTMSSLMTWAGSLSVPLKQLMTSFISYLMVLVWTILIALTSWIYSSFIAQPLVTTAITVFVLLSGTVIYHFERHRRFIRQVEADVVQVREHVYQELSRDPKPEVQPEVIRERIGWMLYPRSHVQRERLRKVVFPFVVRDIATDDRIRKSYSGAPPQLFWKWIDPHPHRSVSQ